MILNQTIDDRLDLRYNLHRVVVIQRVHALDEADWKDTFRVRHVSVLFRTDVAHTKLHP